MKLSSNIRAVQIEDAGLDRLYKFGGSADVDTSNTDLYLDNNYGQAEYPFPSSASVLYLASTDNGDTMDIVVQGLDANYDELEETITLTGQTSAASSSSFLRVNRAWVSGGTECAGYVSVMHTDDFTSGVPQDSTKVLAVIYADHQQTMQCIYTVPNGKTLVISDLDVGVKKGEDVRVWLKVREQGGVFRTKASMVAYQAHDEFVKPEGFRIPAKSDVKFTAIATINNETCYGAFGGFLQ